MNVTNALFALSVHNNAIVDFKHSRCPKRRRDLQIIAALALQQFALLSAPPKPPKPCERCNGRGTIEGAMEWSWVGGYPDARVYVCECVADESGIEF